ncbi:MAG: hypothetical protein HRU36_01710 [Rickettsiales bacterium]|nr:hypothetical protein [Rickettsiales bacterium]
MAKDLLQTALGWATLINFGMIFCLHTVLKINRDRISKFYSSLFKKLSIEKFDEIHYMSITFFKILWVVFNLVPYAALYIASK